MARGKCEKQQVNNYGDHVSQNAGIEDCFHYKTSS